MLPEHRGQSIAAFLRRARHPWAYQFLHYSGAVALFATVFVAAADTSSPRHASARWQLRTTLVSWAQPTSATDINRSVTAATSVDPDGQLHVHDVHNSMVNGTVRRLLVPMVRRGPEPRPDLVSHLESDSAI